MNPGNPPHSEHLAPPLSTVSNHWVCLCWAVCLVLIGRCWWGVCGAVIGAVLMCQRFSDELQVKVTAAGCKQEAHR